MKSKKMKDQSCYVVVEQNKTAYLWRYGRFSLQVMLLLVLWTQTALSLTISMTDVGSSPMTATQLIAFQEAADLWEAIYSDPVTVYINIAFEPLEDGILGSTNSARTTQFYHDVRDALIADASISEKATVNSLPTSSLPVRDINGDRFDSLVTLTTANAKALGLGTGLDEIYPNPPAGVDAEIKFNTLYAGDFDYDPSDGISFNKADFVAVAAHEIGHALGFISVTDIQDYNPGFTFHPSVLDFYRYYNTGPNFFHNLTTEGRQITHVDAEYYDSSMNNVPLSHGVMDTTDTVCNSPSILYGCQASHWSDDQGLLMDPTLAPGILQTIEPKDVHALDFIGWNQKLVLKEYIQKFFIGWFLIQELPEIPPFSGEFDDFPTLPPPEIIHWPANETLALRAGFDLGYEGGIRSGLGYARFVPAVGIKPTIIQSPPRVEGGEDLYPLGEPATEIPANLSEVFIQSDLEGVPFSFQSNCGETGCPFDPSLGTFGGYRVPGFVYGQGDHRADDVDGVLTLVMLATDDSGIPQPNFHNIFDNGEDREDNNIIILDPEAIGAIMPPECGDASHPIPLASLDGNCLVNFNDFRLFAQEWLLCTDPFCP